MATVKEEWQQEEDMFVDADFQYFDEIGPMEQMEKVYSEKELLEVIAELATLNFKEFSIVQLKIRNPGISLSEIGTELSITKQAVALRIQKIVSNHHCFDKILKNKKPGGQIFFSHNKKVVQ